MTKKLISQSFPLARPFDQSGDIEELQIGVGDFGRLNNPSNLLKSFIRNWHNTFIGFYGTEGIIGGRSVAACQGIEDGGFSYIGKTNNAAGEAHKTLTLAISGQLFYSAIRDQHYAFNMLTVSETATDFNLKLSKTFCV